MTSSVLGLDIGGANLKAAHSNGVARTYPFSLWKNPAGLPAALASLVASMPIFELAAVTMTGELCDCYETRRQGVLAILDAVEETAGSVPIQVWQWAAEEQTGEPGRFVPVTVVRRQPLQAAAGNWLALAAFGGRYAAREAALVFDIGSTTTDIVPLLDGQPVPLGFQRSGTPAPERVGIHRSTAHALVRAVLSQQGCGRTIRHHTRRLSRVGSSGRGCQ